MEFYFKQKWSSNLSPKINNLTLKTIGFRLRTVNLALRDHRSYYKPRSYHDPKDH